MKKILLIVDDEEIIRKGLIARLNYLGFFFDKILEAGSGVSALSLVKENSVTIVITDIQMPDMDGLTFIREAKKVNSRLRFIILSGYTEFEYAKTALHLGVTAYLLKPLSNEHLREALENLLQTIKADSITAEGIRTRKSLARKNMEYLLEKEINALLHEPCESISIAKYPVFYSQVSPLPDRLLLLCIIHIEKVSGKNTFTGENPELIWFIIKNVFQEISSSYKTLLANSVINPQQMYAIFESNHSKKSELRRAAEQVFLKMRAVLETKLDIYLSFGVGRLSHDLSSDILFTAESALAQRIIHGNGNLYFYEDNIIFSEKTFPSAKIHSLEQYLIQGNITGIRRILDQLFSADIIKECGFSYIRILWVRILNLLLKYYEPEIKNFIGIDNFLRMFNKSDKFDHPKRIHNNTIDIISECINNRKISDSNSQNKIYLAMQYMQKHYNENLTINHLASLYSMSPNYFSSIFKKEIGQTPINYITDIRLKKAREYLAGTNLSVVEIAENVGYEDSQYFFRVFKKTTGITPLQYRHEHSR